MNDPETTYHRWQILTYAWLRSQLPGAKRVIGGILFYLNELDPSNTARENIRSQVQENNTDVMPEPAERQELIADPLAWVPTNAYRLERSIRMVMIDEQAIDQSRSAFRDVVARIESCVQSEIRDGAIMSSWQPTDVRNIPTRPRRRDCTACDANTFCPDANPSIYPVRSIR